MEHNKAEVLGKLEAKLTSKYGEKLAKTVIVKLAPRLVPGLSQALVLKDIYDTLKDLEEFGSLIEQKRSEDASKKQEKSKVVAAAGGGNNGQEPDDESSEDEGWKDPSTPVGKKGYEHKITHGNNIAKEIDGISYSGHALDRMQQRGIMPSVVKDTIKNGIESPGNIPDTIRYYDQCNNVTVVKNVNNNKIITVYIGWKQ